MTALGLRRRPRHEVVNALRSAGVSQETIAARARVSRTYVNLTIARRTPPGDRAERVWRAIEEATRDE